MQRSGTEVVVMARRREDPLPAPFAGGVRILAPQGIGEGDLARTVGEVTLVLLADVFQVQSQSRDAARRHHGAAVLPALAVSDMDLELLDVHVLHPQLERLEQAKPATVQETTNEGG